MLTKKLASEIASLDDDQRTAVVSPGNVVAVAGPGSGKTRTLVDRAGYLLAEVVSPRRGVAALTYTTKAADEIARRLRRLGMYPGRRVVSRTVHSFCLNEVLRPLGPLVGDSLPDDTVVPDDDSFLHLLETCLDDHGVLNGKVEWFRSRVTRIRRSAAAGEDLSGFEDKWVTAVADFEDRLYDHHLLDFEAMTGRALKLLRSDPSAALQVIARFPQIVVDEYQDLGPVLHAIVLTLLRHGATITAVGDPDQTMYAYDGADPKYLRSLADRDDFIEVPLRLNYRSGPVIIAASHGALGQLRNHAPHPGRTHPGVVLPVKVKMSLNAHATAAVDAVNELAKEGVPLEQIAVLYPRRGELVDVLLAKFQASGIPLLVERERSLPAGAISDFVSACAARLLTGPLPTDLSESVSSDVSTIHELSVDLRQLRVDAGLSTYSEPLKPLGRELVAVLDGVPRAKATDPAAPFVEQLSGALHMDDISEQLGDKRDQVTMPGLRTACNTHSLCIAELARGRVPGRVVVTTYHSAKGREFTAVVLPGLCEGIVPKYDWIPARKRWIPNESRLPEERRNFYVALTRASETVVLIYGEGWGIGWKQRRDGHSRFVDDVLARIPRDVA